MTPPDSLMVAAFDPRLSRYIVLGQKDLSFPTELAAADAGCIVVPRPRVPLGIVAGDVAEPSPTERAGQLLRRPPVISRIPGTVQLTGQPSLAVREHDAPRTSSHDRRR